MMLRLNLATTQEYIHNFLGNIRATDTRYHQLCIKQFEGTTNPHHDGKDRPPPSPPPPRPSTSAAAANESVSPKEHNNTFPNG